MKRILMIFVSLVFIICLISCNEEEKVEEINIKFVIEENIYDIKKEVNYIVNIDDIPNINEEDIEGIYYDSNYSSKYNNEVLDKDTILYVRKVNNKEFLDENLDNMIVTNYYFGNPAPREFLNDFYFSRNDLYECKRLNERSYIAGYLRPETIKQLDNVTPVQISFAVSGIDDYFYKYQYAVRMKFIDLVEHPIQYLYVDNDKVELYYKENRLIFILEREKYSRKNIYDDKEKDFYFYFNVKCNKENDTFKINKENTVEKLEHFLFSYDFSKTDALQLDMEMCAAEITFLKGVKCISEPSVLIFEKLNGEEYYEKVKEAILSTKNEYPYGEILVYDYDKWIKILKGDYRSENN